MINKLISLFDTNVIIKITTEKDNKSEFIYCFNLNL